MENKSLNIENKILLPTSLLNDIEFDEFDQGLQLMDKNETKGFSIQR